jgi:hypothetical protein
MQLGNTLDEIIILVVFQVDDERKLLELRELEE